MSTVMYRHGDLLVHTVSKPSRRLVKAWVDGEDAILLRGEATGHNHRLQGDYTLFRENDAAYEAEAGRTFFEVHTKANLNHEEHGVIDLPPGFYASGWLAVEPLDAGSLRGVRMVLYETEEES